MGYKVLKVDPPRITPEWRAGWERDGKTVPWRAFGRKMRKPVRRVIYYR